MSRRAAADDTGAMRSRVSAVLAPCTSSAVARAAVAPRDVLVLAAVVALTAFVGAAGCTAPPDGAGVDDPARDPGAVDDDPRGDDGLTDDERAACPQTARLDELLARLGDELDAKGIPGGAAAIACAGVVVAGGTGVVKQGGDVVDGDTRFQIASVTKTLTAATAALLDADGVLDLDAPLDGLLPDVNVRAPYATSATLADLLAHAAGYPTEIPDADWSHDDLEGFFAGNADVLLWSEPGRVWNYANYGTALAGLVIERAAGAPFGDVVEDVLFAAAGMTTASMHAADVAVDGAYAYGHDASSGGFGGPAVLSPLDSYYGAGWYGPMGGAWCSARDLGTFASRLLGAQGDDDAFAPVRAALSTPRIRTDASPDVHYGMGLFVDRSTDVEVWSHGGSVGGFLTDLRIVPATGVAIVLMVNSSNAFPVDTKDWALAELGGFAWSWDGEAPPPLDDADGTYVDDVVLGDVAIADGRIAIPSLDVDAALHVYAEDTAVFFYADWDMDVPVVFWRDDDGAVEYVSTMLGVARRPTP